MNQALLKQIGTLCAAIVGVIAVYEAFGGAPLLFGILGGFVLGWVANHYNHKYELLQTFANKFKK